MMIAKWCIDAKFGHKPAVVKSLTQWFEQIGWTKDNSRILVGSVGSLESNIISEITIESLTDLNNAWQKLGDIEEHKAWSTGSFYHSFNGLVCEEHIALAESFTLLKVNSIIHLGDTILKSATQIFQATKKFRLFFYPCKHFYDRFSFNEFRGK